MQFKNVLILYFLTLLISSCQNNSREQIWQNSTVNISRFGDYDGYTLGQVQWFVLKGEVYQNISTIDLKNFSEDKLNERQRESFTVIETDSVDLGWAASYDARAKIDFHNEIIWIQTGMNWHNRYAGHEGGWIQRGFQPIKGDKIGLVYMYNSSNLTIYSVSFIS